MVSHGAKNLPNIVPRAKLFQITGYERRYLIGSDPSRNTEHLSEFCEETELSVRGWARCTKGKGESGVTINGYQHIHMR